jgi:hypothetical protein
MTLDQKQETQQAGFAGVLETENLGEKEMKTNNKLEITVSRANSAHFFNASFYYQKRKG